MTTRGFTFRCRFGGVFMETVRKGQSPSWPQPEGRRWGVRRDEGGESMAYLGARFVILTPL